MGGNAANLMLLLSEYQGWPARDQDAAIAAGLIEGRAARVRLVVESIKPPRPAVCAAAGWMVVAMCDAWTDAVTAGVVEAEPALVTADYPCPHCWSALPTVRHDEGTRECAKCGRLFEVPIEFRHDT
jgi:hypothetical protein